jgi:N-acyl-D-aspartate/D-glutamate deacylase
LDWSKSNAALADEMGLSRERLRQIRQELGVPRPAHRRHRFAKSAKVMQWAKDNLEKFKGLSGRELRRKFGIGLWRGTALYQFLRPFLRDGRRKHRWELMDFRLPNRDLERIWRLPHSVVGSHRYAKQLSRSRWYFKHGRGYTHLDRRGQLEAYRRAVKAEERKAAKYFGRA